MKFQLSIKLSLFAAFLALPFHSTAQLRLQSVSGKKTAEIPIGATVGIKLPAPGEQGSDCECSWYYKGILKSTEAGKARLLVQEETLVYQETSGMYKRVQTRYSYPKQEIYTDVDVTPALSVTRHSNGGDIRKGFGALIIGAALLQSLAISPFLSEKSRDVSDKIVWGGVGVGLTMILLPSRKTWHIQQPRGKDKPLWQWRQ